MEKILFLCSANLERSPTAEALFHDVPGWEVESAGTKEYAKTRVTRDLLDWADKIFVMEQTHLADIQKILPECILKTVVLGISDQYRKNSKKLIVLLIWKLSNIEPLDAWLKSKFNLNE